MLFSFPRGCQLIAPAIAPAKDWQWFGKRLAMVELLSPYEYEFEDLRHELSLDLNRSISPRTLRYWLKEIGIERNDLGFYVQDDLQILRLWLQLKPQLKTIERFKNYLRRTRNNAA
jgi:hypothetical protein